MTLNLVFQLMPNRSELQDEISGEVDWQEKSYNVSGQGSHTLKWRYHKDDTVSKYEDCGWVDYVQWTGSPDPPPPPPPDPTTWDTITYKYDPPGRRVLCLCYWFALCGELSDTPADSRDGSGRSGSGLLVRPWPGWIVQLACISLAWRTFVNVLQVQALML